MWIFSKKKGATETIEAIEAVKSELEALKQDMVNFKLRLEAELEAVKHNFDSLVNYFEEDRPENTAEDDTESRSVPGMTETDALNMKQDILYLKRGVMDLLEWTQTIGPEFKNVHDHINESRKDIKNKITYAVSRLKS